MEILTDRSIDYAADMCNAIPNYHIGIAFKDWASFIRCLSGSMGFSLTANANDDIERDLYGHPIRFSGRSMASVYFPNGSYLLMFVAQEGFRGYRFDEIIYEEGISDELIQKILNPMKISTRTVHNPISAGEAMSNLIQRFMSRPLTSEYIIDTASVEDLWVDAAPLHPLSFSSEWNYDNDEEPEDYDLGDLDELLKEFKQQ